MNQSGFPSILFRSMLVVASLLASLPAGAQEMINFRTLHVGFNGPGAPGQHAFESKAQADSSWLAIAMGDELSTVLSKVDFSHELLIVAAVGERSTTTGNVSIAGVVRSGAGVASFVRIGVNEKNCKQPRRPSFPFVVFVIEKPANFDPIEGGYDNQNFPDGCKPVPEGVATSVPASDG